MWATSDTRVPELPVLTASEFERSIAKEVARCQRRPSWFEFGVVSLRFNWQQQLAATHRLVRQIRERIRITDELGWWNDRLAILLPETDRDGVAVVANWVEEKGRDLGLTIATEIMMYPWDDSIGTKSSELWTDVDHAILPPSPTSPISAHSVENRSKGRLKSTPWVSRAKPIPFWKRLVDVVGAGLGMVVLAPVFPIMAWLIRRDSPGSAIYVQWREGFGGRPFRMYKFRTMRTDAEQMQDDLRHVNEQDGPAFKLADDPRVTRFGRWLRKTGLDELPQLWNVLRGEMSLVGPRPLPIHESERCTIWQRNRLTVTPGITCIWQVTGGRNVSFDDWMRMDLAYVKQRSLWLDLRLLWATLRMAIGRRASV